MLFLDVKILGSAGSHPLQGDIHIERERVKHVNSALQVDQLQPDTGVRIRGTHVRTLMLVLGGTYSHLTRNKVDLRALRASERKYVPLHSPTGPQVIHLQTISGYRPPLQCIYVGRLTVRI